MSIARLQAGIVSWLRDALPDATVLWSPSEYPRIAGQELLVAVKILAGPDSYPMGGQTRTPATLPTEITVRILADTADQSVMLECSGRTFEYAFEAGDDVEAIRDGLLAEIGAAPLIDATIVAVSTDEISIVADQLGDLFKVAVRGSVDGLIEVDVVEAEAAVASLMDVETTIEIQAFSTDRSPRTGALGALSQVTQRIRLPSTTELLNVYGISFIGPPGQLLALDGLSGPRWESRAVLDLRVAQVVLAAESLSPIEVVRGTVDGIVGTVTVLVEAE